MSEEEYQDVVDEYQDQQDLTSDVQEAQLEQYESYPTGSKPTETILTWFWKIVNLKDSTKVANLDNTELGPTQLSVRGLQRLALVCDELGEPNLGTYFGNEAEIVLATSMAKKGWLVEQSISQKKHSTRARQRSKEGWKMYQKKNQNTEE